MDGSYEHCGSLRPYLSVVTTLLWAGGIDKVHCALNMDQE